MEARDRLLAAVIDELTGSDNRRRGIGDLSLRGLAAAVGTSHRMLIYHFGSKEGLLIAVVRTMEERQRAVLADLERELDADRGLSPADAFRRFWQRLADPALWPAERLFFELYGQALQGRPGTTPFLDGIVDNWLDPLTESAGRYGVPPEQARTHARLGLAVARGLLLDLLATGNRAEVDAAMERFIAFHPSPQRSSPFRAGQSEH
jgi:AcrR family transcriptional regulator